MADPISQTAYTDPTTGLPATGRVVTGQPVVIQPVVPQAVARQPVAGQGYAGQHGTPRRSATESGGRSRQCHGRNRPDDRPALHAAQGGRRHRADLFRGIATGPRRPGPRHRLVPAGVADHGNPVRAVLPPPAAHAVFGPWWLSLAFVLVGLVLFLVPVLKAKTIRYKISNYRIDFERGWLSKSIDTMELWHVEDLRFTSPSSTASWASGRSRSCRTTTPRPS